MNFQDIKNSKLLYLTPKQVAQALNVSPQKLRIQAKEHPELLGFPVTVIGNRVRIPRLPLITYFENMNGGKNNV